MPRRRARSFGRAFALAFVACAAPLVAAADPVPLVPIPLSAAGPQPFVPIVTAPAVPVSPLGRGLEGAYGAIESATDPTARARASQRYLEARRRAATGDDAGALALADAARAAALLGTPRALQPLPSTIGAGRDVADAAAARTSAALRTPPGWRHARPRPHASTQRKEK